MSTIFGLIGYEKTSPDTLTLQTPVDENRVLVIGFELYLAHTQLHVLRNTQHLTAEYSMEEIMEAWLNTTGSMLDIREWLEKNKLITEIANQSVSSISTDMPGENRPDWFTIGHHFRCDENGRRIDKPTSSQFSMNLRERNWNNIQRGMQLESSLSSLPAVDIPDVNLYGEDDHSASEDIGKKVPESHSRAIGDSGDYEKLENKYLRNLSQTAQVVARGGRADVVPKEEVYKILERRSTTYSSPASAITQEGIANEKLTQEPMIVETFLGVLCAICLKISPAYCCRTCGVNVCRECFYKSRAHFPCVETGHDLIPVSFV